VGERRKKLFDAPQMRGFSIHELHEFVRITRIIAGYASSVANWWLWNRVPLL